MIGKFLDIKASIDTHIGCFTGEIINTGVAKGCLKLKTTTFSDVDTFCVVGLD